jgi:hypothetical protein
MRYGGQRACNPAVSAVSTTFVLFSSGNRPKLGTMKLFLNRRGTATQNGAAPTQLCADLRPPATLGTSPTSVDVAVVELPAGKSVVPHMSREDGFPCQAIQRAT